jgi:hypothetical protein
MNATTVETNTPPTGRKRGRPRSQLLAFVRAEYPTWSERTVARFKAAMERLRLLGVDAEDLATVLDKAKRKNGTLRVSRFDRISRLVFDQVTRPGQDGESR